MLKISQEQMDFLESRTLARWKKDISIKLKQRFPDAARDIEDDVLHSWVRQAMEGARQIGGISRNDLQDFTLTLFHVSEVLNDINAMGDFTAIMCSENTFSAKISMMRKSF